jgi:hypothetical protein
MALEHALRRPLTKGRRSRLRARGGGEGILSRRDDAGVRGRGGWCFLKNFQHIDGVGIVGYDQNS